MKFRHHSNAGKGRLFPGFLRVVTLTLLAAVFGVNALQAQTVAYVAAQTNNVSLIDTATNTITATIQLATPALSLAASPDGTQVYVGDFIGDLDTFQFGPCSVYVIDVPSNTVVRSIALPAGECLTSMAITPDGKTLYGDNQFTGDVLAMDIASGNLITPLSGLVFGAVTMAPNGTAVYTSDPSSILVISTATNTVTATIPTGDFSFPNLRQMAFTPDGSFLYVPLHGPNLVDVVATAGNNNTVVEAQISVGGSPSAIGITPNGAFAYVANTGDNSVSVIDLSTNTVVATIPTSDFGPVFVAFTPDSAFAYVVDENGSVDVISITSQTIVANVPLSGIPVAIVIVKPPSPPTAVAGHNQTITVGQTVHLDGSGSFAPNTPPANLQYEWSFVSRPAGSAATLTGANTATPSFVADAVGDFVAQLVVTDPATHLVSQPSQLTVSSIWSPPTANAGTPQSVTTGSTVQLNGLGSTDPNGLPLTYDWSFQSKPAGSAAVITPGSNGLASFVADVAGTYIVQLVVSDPFGGSTPATTTITATTPETAQQLLQDAINFIGGLSATNFDATGHQTALINQLQDTITAIQKDKIRQASSKLSDAITRTDGFPLRGKLDGSGPDMDWVINQADQKTLYQTLTAALNQLKSM